MRWACATHRWKALGRGGHVGYRPAHTHAVGMPSAMADTQGGADRLGRGDRLRGGRERSGRGDRHRRRPRGESVPRHNYICRDHMFASVRTSRCARSNPADLSPFFLKGRGVLHHLGALRRLRRPGGRAPFFFSASEHADSERRDLSGATPRFDLAPRHSPSACAEKCV